MKLTPVNKKLENSIRKSIDLYDETYDSISREVRRKISNEIWNPNFESISWMQQRILNNLQNEINTSKR